MIPTFFANEFDSILIIGVCLVCSAFFSLSETAITSLGTLKVKHLLDSKGKKAAYLNLWLTNPERVITTILLFNTVMNILASAVTTDLATKYFSSGAIGISTGLTTFWVLIFGEIIPKSFAKAHAESLALVSMRIIYYVYYATYPVIVSLSSLAEMIIKLVSRGRKSFPLITEEEIEFIVNEGEKAGVIEDIKKEIIVGAFDFDETKVREIMTPRTSIAAVSADTTLEKVKDLIVATGHSRIPVYRNHIDHMVGIVLAKDLLNEVSYKNSPTKVETIMRQALFAPESRTIMEVFKDLKRSKSHMAIIIDEYGGTAGLVTMEDILEEIVGEIQDEYDTEEAKIIQIDASTYEVSGTINIDEFLDYFKIEENDLSEDHKDQDVDTLAGWITQLVGQMPKAGQKVTAGPLNMEVLQVKNRRIDLVRVAVHSQTEASHDGSN